MESSTPFKWRHLQSEIISAALCGTRSATETWKR
jgi:hypothetical protein